MKFINIIAIIIIPYLFLSCDLGVDDTIEYNTITGRFNNWTGGNNKSLKCKYGSGKINADGSFSIKLNVIADSALDLVTNILRGYTQCYPSPNISDLTAKVGGKIEEFDIVLTDNQNIIVGKAYKTSLRNSMDAIFVYANKNVSISGVFECLRISSNRIKKFTWNIDLQKGWNTIYVDENDIDPDRPCYNIATTDEPADRIWMFYLYP